MRQKKEEFERLSHGLIKIWDGGYNAGDCHYEETCKNFFVIIFKNHENVVRLHEVLDDPTADKLYIVMEFVKNGSLQSAINKKEPLTTIKIWKYFRDITAGLIYCKIIHINALSA